MYNTCVVFFYLNKNEQNIPGDVHVSSIYVLLPQRCWDE